MSEEKNNSVSSVFDMISKLQRYIFYATLFLIPWFVIPLPYDSTEKIKSVLFIFLSCLVILLEIIKWVWDGKISIVKSSLDKVFLLILISFVLSTIFARDSWMSFWGYDGRLGTGLFVMIFLFLFFYLSRGFLQKKKEIINGVLSLSIGLLVMIILSMLSVLKVDIFGWLPYINNFFVVGLPLTFSFQEAMLISGLSVFLNLFLLVSFIQDKKYQGVIFPIIGLLISFVSLTLFSITQGALVPVLFLIVSIPVCIFLWFKLNKSLKAIPVIIFIFSLLSVGMSIGFQYQSFIKSILGDSFTTINPIRLGSDISWVVASSSIVNDFLRGLIGLGNDSFGIAYNLFKPSTEAIIGLGNTTFVSASNEVFTTLANRGLIGVTIWIILGIAYLRIIIKQITSGKDSSALAFLLALTGMFLFLGSAFVPFSFLTYFLLFVSTLMLVVFDNKEGSNEEFLVKFWAVNVGKVNRDINKTVEGVNWFVTVAVTLLTTAGLILLFIKTMSSAYIVRAEAYNLEMNDKYKNEKEVSSDVREEYLKKMIGYYDKALKYDRTDPYANRRTALVSTEIIKLLSEKYADLKKDDEKEALLSNITTWKNTSLDLSREAINTSPLAYANWNARAAVYIGLITVGLSDYSQDALNSLQSCINLNPLDYDSYYKAGQIYMVKEDYDKALAAFRSVLNINGQHVPSLVLSANILNEKGDKEGSITYLKAAKEVLELNKLDSGEMYQNITDSLKELGGDKEDVSNIKDLKTSDKTTSE